MASFEWEILEALPPYGPLPEQFGIGTHREGFVVRIRPLAGPPWVGNFQRACGFDAIARHPDGARVVVIAGGEAYVVDPSTRRLVECFGGDIEHAIEMSSIPALALGCFTHFTIIFTDARWRTPRLSWDGFRNVRVEDATLKGEGYDPMRDGWYPFDVDVRAKRAESEAYRA